MQLVSLPAGTYCVARGNVYEESPVRSGMLLMLHEHTVDGGIVLPHCFVVNESGFVLHVPLKIDESRRTLI